jgi:hypothetical protein
MDSGLKRPPGLNPGGLCSGCNPERLIRTSRLVLQIFDIPLSVERRGGPKGARWRIGPSHLGSARGRSLRMFGMQSRTPRKYLSPCPADLRYPPLRQTERGTKGGEVENSAIPSGISQKRIRPDVRDAIPNASYIRRRAFIARTLREQDNLLASV